MSSSIKYYEVLGPADRSIANFLERTLAEAYVLRIQEEYAAEVNRKVGSGLIITEGERKGELNYAIYGIRIAERVIRFSDAEA